MVLILIEAGDIYYNTQVYFRQHYIDDLPNDDRVWAAEYSRWLLTQGCVIVPFEKEKVVTALGVAPYLDQFGFENESDAIMFMLRWS